MLLIMIFIGDFIMSSKKTYSHRRREYWQGVIEQWKLSNLSCRNFCKKNGLTVSAFYKWRQRLDCAQLSKKSDTSGFLEVSIPAVASAPVQITLAGGAVIDINHAAKSDLLTRVFTSLRESGLC